MKKQQQQQHLVVDPFCFRQFVEHANSSYGGTVFHIAISDFEKIANERFSDDLLQPGYAPFCKHLFIKNDFTDAQVNVLPITNDNQDKIRTKYEARNDKELPVLNRFFPLELVANSNNDNNTLPVAKYLDLILYSREQINMENEAQGRQTTNNDEEAPWGIVSIKAQDVNYELPMNPITIMRNSLGKEQGGSGVPLDRDAYLASVDYWKNHAVVSWWSTLTRIININNC